MPKLGVNIDHVATLRQARRALEPQPLKAALICERAGADSIVVHLREDRRHINDGDVLKLRKSIKTKLNLEMSTAPGIVDIACRIRPDQATLVPEKRQELTTEGGLDVLKYLNKTARVIKKLQNKGIEVSLFIDPCKEQIDAAKMAGASMVELHTGRFADANNKAVQEKYFEEIREAAKYTYKLGLTVNAGHGLNYSNVSRIAKIKEIRELNIGYSIICRALFTGLDKAVREMKALI
ncbi:MAG: pyridoxine 5'-phosphate synthase [Candidatus Omnitrophota bacterium]|jgi:pyridoxine 5-phosphate synthase